MSVDLSSPLSWGQSGWSAGQRFCHWIAATDIVITTAPQKSSFQPNQRTLYKRSFDYLLDHAVGYALGMKPLPREDDIPLPIRHIGPYGKALIIARRIALCMAVVLFVSAVGMGFGGGLQFIGTAIRNFPIDAASEWSDTIAVASKHIIHLGRNISQSARVVGLTCTLPLYGAFYAGPKWVCTRAIPSLVSMAFTATKFGAVQVGALLSWIAKVAQPHIISVKAAISSTYGWTTVQLKPFFDFLTKSIYTPAIDKLNLGIHSLYDGGSFLATKLGARILSPIWSTVSSYLLTPFYTALIEPSLRGMSTLLKRNIINMITMVTLIWNKIFQPIAQPVFNFLTYAWKDLLLPQIFISHCPQA